MALRRQLRETQQRQSRASGSPAMSDPPFNREDEQSQLPASMDSEVRILPRTTGSPTLCGGMSRTGDCPTLTDRQGQRSEQLFSQHSDRQTSFTLTNASTYSDQTTLQGPPGAGGLNALRSIVQALSSRSDLECGAILARLRLGQDWQGLADDIAHQRHLQVIGTV